MTLVGSGIEMMMILIYLMPLLMRLNVWMLLMVNGCKGRCFINTSFVYDTSRICISQSTNYDLNQNQAIFKIIGYPVVLALF